MGIEKEYCCYWAEQSEQKMLALICTFKKAALNFTMGTGSHLDHNPSLEGADALKKDLDNHAGSHLLEDMLELAEEDDHEEVTTLLANVEVVDDEFTLQFTALLCIKLGIKGYDNLVARARDLHLITQESAL